MDHIDSTAIGELFDLLAELWCFLVIDEVISAKHTAEVKLRVLGRDSNCLDAM